ncbi:NAD(P)-dependent dehydrogenase (short-subunit alcohol dehydrogenase family) [Mycetocola sp. BIGb0189]|uniref:SDR family NAD(P)-dependent oxidoreductase n=1 Tax=Mycetocola sp. BIGb0189 TaxID=2940604 RepID=UPI0021688E3B|nr:SDR family NAD(P)-dependent oxidoreductase [Mycetocola sp. BIGb0189]MCS4275991.1 NAD(P)-dependent dehydrogenase (short-subunit alcohol dehydrogenase family) [Mycetocola sp. BIGb0189]
MATYDVANRSAIVSGAGAGIGRAVAELLAANGTAVLLVDRDQAAVEAVYQEIIARGGAAATFVADVTSPDWGTESVRLAEAMAPLGIAVNNAGISGPSAPLTEYTPEDWHRVISINLDSLYTGMRAQIPAMAAHGGGAVVNLASILGTVGQAGASAYVTAKHGVVGMTKSAALENARTGVRVNAVAPGYVHTPMIQNITTPESYAALVALHPMGRLATAEEIAQMVAFLASDAAGFVTGSTHLVDGGYSAR